MNTRTIAAAGCSGDAKRQLAAFLGLAQRYAAAADDELRAVAALSVRERRATWAGSGNAVASLRHWFGPYSNSRLRFIARVFAESRKRLHQGFDIAGKREPMRIKCLSERGTRCETRRLLLANASDFGTIKVCPRLLSKSLEEGAMTLLHESLHHLMGVNDQRATECSTGGDSRCYRDGARALVLAGKFAKALRNNDNHVSFARAVHDRRTIQVGSQKAGEMTRANRAISRKNSDSAYDQAEPHDAMNGCGGGANCSCGSGTKCRCGGCPKCRDGGLHARADLDAWDQNDGNNDAPLDADDDADLGSDALGYGVDMDADQLNADGMDAEDDLDADDDLDAEDALDADDDLDAEDALDADDDLDADDELDADDLDADDLDDLDRAEFDADEFVEGLDHEDNYLEDGIDNFEVVAHRNEGTPVGDAGDRVDLKPTGIPCPGAWKFIIRKDRDGKHYFDKLTGRSLCQALVLAQTWATRTKTVFDKIWRASSTRKKKKAWKACPEIKAYMGEKHLSREAIRKVRLRVNRIYNRLNSHSIRFIFIPRQLDDKSYLCKPESNAYSTPSTGIKLCPNFFRSLNPAQRAQVIIHELIHMFGWGIHYRIPGGQRVSSTVKHRVPALFLAAARPWRARRNAVNYSWLLRAVSNGSCKPFGLGSRGRDPWLL